MDSADQVRACYEQWQREGERMAGGLSDLAQRAAVYHHLFEHSGRNHAFPLIAAHGALWARGYFRFGSRLGEVLAPRMLVAADVRQRRLQALADFADAFRDVNRRVCADTYASYHFTARYGEHPAACALLPPALLDSLNRIHAARRAGCELSDGDKRQVFEAFFLNEQQTVVGPCLASAVEAFDWPLVKRIALRPLIRFAYFPRWRPFWFRNFADRAERIERGMQAFDLAARAGWSTVEASLGAYDVLPSAFFRNPAVHFQSLRAAVTSV